MRVWHNTAQGFWFEVPDRKGFSRVQPRIGKENSSPIVELGMDIIGPIISLCCIRMRSLIARS